MTTVELRILKSGDYVTPNSDEFEQQGIKNGLPYRVTKVGVAKWEKYYYVDIKKPSGGIDFEIYYKNAKSFDIL